MFYRTLNEFAVVNLINDFQKVKINKFKACYVDGNWIYKKKQPKTWTIGIERSYKKWSFTDFSEKVADIIPFNSFVETKLCIGSVVSETFHVEFKLLAGRELFFMSQE